MNDYLIASGTLFSFLFALCWSYYMATRVIPPKVISQMESKYSDPEWLTNMFSTSWDLMGDSMGPKIQDSIMKSLRMSTLRDIRTLGNDVETLEDEVIDSFVEYSFRTDIYQKNVPYKVILSFAYQTRSKSFTDNVTRTTILLELNSIILGTRIDMQVTDYLSVMTNLESSIYSFGSAGASLLTLLATGINAYLFNVTAGFTLSVDRLMARDDLG